MCIKIFVERVIFMTLKQYIQELSKRLSNQWQGQISLKSRLNSQLMSIDEMVAQGKTGYDSELKQLESQIEVIENQQKHLRKTSEFVYSCATRVDSDVVHTQSERIKGDRGGTVSEEVYQLDNDMSFTQRNTTINGQKYGFMKTTIGKQTQDMSEPYAEIKEGFENGERTFYESWANGGSYERIDKELAYDDVTTTSPSGIEVQTKKRNPAKDFTRRETRDNENGTTITIDRPIVDKDGHIMGSYNFSEQQNTHKFDEEYFKKKTIIESKCKDKDGNDIVLRTEIRDNGMGIINRTDYVNGQMLTQAIMNDNEHFFAITNYQDGKKVNWSRYDGRDGEWYMNQEKFFDKDGGYELDEEDMTGYEHRNPEEIKFERPEDIFYSQSAFMDGAYMPEELQDLLFAESFDEKATGRSYIGAKYELDDDNMKKLKDRQQQREQNRDKSSQQKKDWD